MANKGSDGDRIEKGLQPISRPLTTLPSQGEQAGLQPIVRPNPTGSGSGTGSGKGGGEKKPG